MMTGGVVVGAKFAHSCVPLIQHAMTTAGGEPITVIHVRVPPNGWATLDSWSSAASWIWQDELECEVRTAAMIALDTYDGPWQVVVRRGEAAGEIVAQADQEYARKIVVGASRRHPLTRRHPVPDQVKTLTSRRVEVVARHPGGRSLRAGRTHRPLTMDTAAGWLAAAAPGSAALIVPPGSRGLPPKLSHYQEVHDEYAE